MYLQSLCSWVSWYTVSQLAAWGYLNLDGRQERRQGWYRERKVRAYMWEWPWLYSHQTRPLPSSLLYPLIWSVHLPLLHMATRTVGATSEIRRREGKAGDQVDEPQMPALLGTGRLMEHVRKVIIKEPTNLLPTWSWKLPVFATSQCGQLMKVRKSCPSTFRLSRLLSSREGS